MHRTARAMMQQATRHSVYFLVVMQVCPLTLFLTQDNNRLPQVTLSTSRNGEEQWKKHMASLGNEHRITQIGTNKDTTQNRSPSNCSRMIECWSEIFQREEDPESCVPVGNRRYMSLLVVEIRSLPSTQ